MHRAKSINSCRLFVCSFVFLGDLILTFKVERFVSLATTARLFPQLRSGTMLHNYKEDLALLIALGFLANTGRARQVAVSTVVPTAPGGGGGVISISEFYELIWYDPNILGNIACGIDIDCGESTFVDGCCGT